MVVQLPANGTGTVVDTATVGSKDREIVVLGDPATAAQVAGVVPKATQGGYAITTQDMKDSGRTPVVLSASAVASVTTAALFTLNIWRAGTVTSASSYTVTSGKTFRIQAIQFGTRFATPSTTVTFGNVTFGVRAVASGALSATSALLYSDSKMAASNTATPNSDLGIEDGLELPSGYVFGVSHVASATTLVNDVLIVGFEY